MSIEVKVWDWPLRLFHWLLVIAVTGAYATGKLGGNWTDWHARFGSFILGLLIFRLLWGFFGSPHARFSHFFPTPTRLRAYFRGQWSGAGHNPLGAFAVFALLAVLIVLATTGLFANDDIAFEGPLFDTIDKNLSDQLSGWHLRSVNVLLVLVGLHVSAIIFYQLVKKANLVRPMLTGKQRLTVHHARHLPSARVAPARLALSLAIAGLMVWGVWRDQPLRDLAALIGIQTAQAHYQP